MEYKKNILGIREERAQDDLKAAAERLEADLDYVAMMADVELDSSSAEEESSSN